MAQIEWKGMDILSVHQFNQEKLESLFNVADRMREMVKRQGSDDSLKGKILANIFYEPSTRTSCSFQAAMKRLGGEVICVNESSSSVKKGETLSDTIKSLACYADVVVLRHPQKGSAQIAAQSTKKPLLNAGDGVGEHPTQALLDLYTIANELLPPKQNILKNIVVTLVGDLKNGRTVHSLSKLLALYDVKLNFVSPESLKMPQYIVEELQNSDRDVIVEEFCELSPSIVQDSDVIYVTRVQKERFDSVEDYEKVKDSFCITPATLLEAKKKMILMHPLPRVGEIAVEVDEDPRAAYFRQMENGMFVRMALLSLVLLGNK